jgi:hypothetical protein
MTHQIRAVEKSAAKNIPTKGQNPMLYSTTLFFSGVQKVLNPERFLSTSFYMSARNLDGEH